MVPGIALRIPSLALVMASALFVACSDSAPPVSPRAIALEHAAHVSVAGNPSAYLEGTGRAAAGDCPIP